MLDVGVLSKKLNYNKMNNAQKFLIENNLDDIVLNATKFKENTTENAKQWIYLSDILELYLESTQQELNIQL